MYMDIYKRRDFYNFCVLFFIYFFIYIVAGRNLFADTLWYDEAGQFFISKGLNHFSAPFSPEGNLGDVLYNNSHYNHDPGMFSIILFFWAKVSNHYFWLRLLPFSLFILFNIFTILVIYRVSLDKKFAIIGGLLVFGVMRSNYTYMLRPYSMELLCTSFGIWAIFFIKEKLSYSRLSLCSILLAILMGARYSAVPVVFVLECVGCYLIIKESGGITQIIKKLLAWGMPTLIAVVNYYVISLSIQNPGLAQLSHTKSLHTDISPLYGISGVCLLVIPVSFILLKKRMNDSMKLLFTIVLTIEFLFVAMSLRGSVPFDLNEFHCAPLLWLILLLGVCTAYPYINRIKYKYTLVTTLFIVAIAATVYRSKSPLLLSYYKSGYYQTNAELRKLDISKAPLVFVTFELSPTVKYYFEYNEKGKKSYNSKFYKNKFIFAKGFEHVIKIGEDPKDRFRQIEKNHRDIVDEIPNGSFILGRCKTTWIEDHEDFSDVKNLPGFNQIFIKNK